MASSTALLDATLHLHPLCLHTSLPHTPGKMKSTSAVRTARRGGMQTRIAPWRTRRPGLEEESMCGSIALRSRRVTNPCEATL